MISLHRLACRAYGAHAGRSPRTATPATEVQHNDHRNALGGNVLQKTPGSLWRKRKRATGPASAPKLRQNRFKYSATPKPQLLGAGRQANLGRLTDRSWRAPYLFTCLGCVGEPVVVPVALTVPIAGVCRFQLNRRPFALSSAKSHTRSKTQESSASSLTRPSGPTISLTTRPGQNHDFSFKSATKLRPQMVYELNEKSTI
jgi:hypothetical protein